MDLTKELVKSVEVKSLANGQMLVIPNYKFVPESADMTPAGVLERLTMAGELGRLINAELKEEPCQHEWGPADPKFCHEGVICHKCETIKRADGKEWKP